MTNDTTTDRTGHTAGLARGEAGRDDQLLRDEHMAGGLSDVDRIAHAPAQIVNRLTASVAFQASAMAYGELSASKTTNVHPATDIFSSDYREHGTYST